MWALSAPRLLIGLLAASSAHVHVPQLSVSLSDNGMVRREVPRVVRCSTTKGALDLLARKAPEDVPGVLKRGVLSL